MKSRSIIILFIALSVFQLSCLSGRHAADEYVFMDVMSVVDGDTFRASDGSERGIKVRLIGVDAPESRNSGQKRIGFYGHESKTFLTKLISGKRVRLEYDVGRKDKYNRTLAYVYLADGTFVNAELIKKGYAMVMTVPPNVKYAEKFVKLQKGARNKNRGLWNGGED